MNASKSNPVIITLERILLSLVLLGITPVFCINISFAILFPKEHISVPTIDIIITLLPLATYLLLSGIPFFVSGDASNMWINLLITSIFFIGVSGCIYWTLHYLLKMKVAISIWVAVTATLWLIEVAGVLLFIGLAIASTGL